MIKECWSVVVKRCSEGIVSMWGALIYSALCSLPLTFDCGVCCAIVHPIEGGPIFGTVDKFLVLRRYNYAKQTVVFMYFRLNCLFLSASISS